MRLKRQSFYLGIILAWCPCGDLLAEPGEPKPAAPQRNLIVPPIPKGAVDGLSSDLHEERQKAYQEVQASNLSKACQTEEEAQKTVEVRSAEQGEKCHYEKVDNKFIVYRTRDRKVMKNINYFRPDLKKFF